MQPIFGFFIITNTDPRQWSAPVITNPPPGTQRIIGRDPHCEIVIPREFRSVSRHHAAFGLQRQGLWIEDLNSTGGTEVNGVPLVPKRNCQLVFGDRLRLAGLELYLVSPESGVIFNVMRVDVHDSNDTVPINVPHAGHVRRSIEDTVFGSLSPAEMEIVRWVSRGLSTNQELAEKLYRSPHTIRTQMASIFNKLNVHSREQIFALLKKMDIAWTTGSPDDEYRASSAMEKTSEFERRPEFDT